jgi:hypothetical protein
MEAEAGKRKGIGLQKAMEETKNRENALCFNVI